MKGVVGFEQYKIDCIIGVYPEERAAKQPVYIDLKVETDFSKCTKSDDIADALNYEFLAKLCNSLAGTRNYSLLETFACEVLDNIFLKFDVSWAWVRIKKSGGLTDSKYTLVELERYKNEK